MKNKELRVEAEVPESLADRRTEQVDWKLALWQLSLQKMQSALTQQ